MEHLKGQKTVGSWSQCCNKLECLPLVSFFSLVRCLWEKLGAYSRVEHLKGQKVNFGSWSGKHLKGTQKLASDKHSNLFASSLTEGPK